VAARARTMNLVCILKCGGTLKDGRWGIRPVVCVANGYDLVMIRSDRLRNMNDR